MWDCVLRYPVGEVVLPTTDDRETSGARSRRRRSQSSSDTATQVIWAVLVFFIVALGAACIVLALKLRDAGNPYTHTIFFM